MPENVPIIARLAHHTIEFTAFCVELRPAGLVTSRNEKVQPDICNNNL
jgi:hypothetical protein